MNTSRMSLRTRVVAALVVCGMVTSAASAASFTLLTFADPTTDSTTPMFASDGAILSGNWLGQPGLTLETPGLPASPDYPDAQFRMTSLTIGAGGVTGPGSITFLDSGSNILATIAFDSGQLSEPFGFGASDFELHNVSVTGAIVPIPLADETFAFSFTNPDVIGNTTNYTAAFTSSTTTFVPEPATMVLLLSGAGTALGLRRRR